MNTSSTAYAYTDDYFGAKSFDANSPNLYSQRPSLFDNLKQVNQDVMDNGGKDNEVMIKDRIPPEYIKGIVVPNQAQKDHFITLLTQQNHILTGQIKGIPVDSFIQIATKCNEVDYSYC